MNKLLPHLSYFGGLNSITLLQRSFISSSPCVAPPAPNLCAHMADDTHKATMKNIPVACAVPLWEGIVLPWPYLGRKRYTIVVTPQ